MDIKISDNYTSVSNEIISANFNDNVLSTESEENSLNHEKENHNEVFASNNYNTVQSAIVISNNDPISMSSISKSLLHDKKSLNNSFKGHGLKDENNQKCSHKDEEGCDQFYDTSDSNAGKSELRIDFQSVNIKCDHAKYNPEEEKIPSEYDKYSILHLNNSINENKCKSLQNNQIFELHQTDNSAFLSKIKLGLNLSEDWKSSLGTSTFNNVGISATEEYDSGYMFCNSIKNALFEEENQKKCNSLKLDEISSIIEQSQNDEGKLNSESKNPELMSEAKNIVDLNEFVAVESNKNSNNSKIHDNFPENFFNIDYKNIQTVGEETASEIQRNNTTVSNNGIKEDVNFSSNCVLITKSNLKRTNVGDVEQECSLLKKSKRGITFDSVSVYYFPRTQGFTCIPSQGGSTLGMSWNHSHIRTFSLGEHAAEQRRAHRQFCSQQFSSSREWKEISNLSSEDSDSDEIISDSEIDYENLNFLQPIPTRERRAMLRDAGIQKINSTEKDECRSIRLSREFCGCTCQMYCDPDRCVCAQAGIKCQVDRMNFPCSCTRDGCANENGRIEFNPVRVRTHYIHTLMRLEMEKKKEEEEEEQRNKLIINNSKTSQSSNFNAISDSFVNFSYDNDLQSYHSQSNTFNVGTTASPVANSCFNFFYSADSNHFDDPSSAETTFHQSQSSLATSSKLSTPASSSAMEYCSQLSLPVGCLSAPACNDLMRQRGNQNFIINNLTSLENNDSDMPYNSDSFIQLTSEHFEQNSENINLQIENLDTSTEVSEETEKEESDSENFGDIIKKTMVETVIA